MLIGTIRPRETRTADITGEDLDEIRANAAASVPDGWMLTDAPVKMHPGTTSLTAIATMIRVDGLRDIEADDMTALEAKVPEGWQLLSVRSL